MSWWTTDQKQKRRLDLNNTYLMRDHARSGYSIETLESRRLLAVSVSVGATLTSPDGYVLLSYSISNTGPFSYSPALAFMFGDVLLTSYNFMSIAPGNTFSGTDTVRIPNIHYSGPIIATWRDGPIFGQGLGNFTSWNYYPDVVVTSFSLAPTSENGKLRATYTVQNIGVRPAHLYPFYIADRFYLVDAATEQLLSYPENSLMLPDPGSEYLAAGSSYSAVVDLNVPNVGASFRVRLVTNGADNGYNHLLEDNSSGTATTNNSESNSSIFRTWDFFPDVVVTNFSLSPTPTNGILRTTYTVKNIGSRPAHTIYEYDRLDIVDPTSGEALTSGQPNSMGYDPGSEFLAPGSSYSTTIDLVVPNSGISFKVSLSTNNWSQYYRIPEDNSSGTGNSNNTSLDPTIYHSWDFFPDLVVNYIQFGAGEPGQVWQPNKFSVELSFKNVGVRTIPVQSIGNTIILEDLTDNTAFAFGYAYYSPSPTDHDMAPGDSILVRAIFNKPSEDHAYRATASLDSTAGNSIREDNPTGTGETNNSASRSFTLASIPAATPIFSGSYPGLRVPFGIPLARIPTPSEIIVTSLGSNLTVPPNSYSVNPTGANDGFEIRFAAPLANDNYNVTIPGGTVLTNDDQLLLGNISLDYFVLAGDANRDRYVNAADQAILNANIGLSGKTFAQGDFDYNGTVNAADLTILNSNFHIYIPLQGPYALPTTPGADKLRVSKENASFADVFVGVDSAPTYRILSTAISEMSFTGGNGNDELTVDFTNGSPFPGTNLIYDGGANSDTLHIVGTTGANLVYFDTNLVQFDSVQITSSNNEQLSFDGKGGMDYVSLAQNISLQFMGTQVLQYLYMPSNTVVSIAASGNSVLDVTNLFQDSSARIDLANNAMILRSGGALPGIVSKILTGQNGFDNINGQANWDGNGIISSTARTLNVGLAVDLYGIGAIRNGDLDDLNGEGSRYTIWQGRAVGAQDVLIRFTYLGDADLNGTVTIDDYNMIDGAALGLFPLTGWVSGNFDYTGSTVTIDDYNAIDTGYLYQAGSLGV